MYHKVAADDPTMWWVNADEFYRQMFELQDKKVVYLDDYDPIDESHAVITFDGIYKNVLTFAAPILQKFGYPFELFITSDYLAKDNSFDTVEPLVPFTTIEELKQLEQYGGRIQWHTKSHPDLKNETDPVILERELTAPVELNIFNDKSFKWFAYPYGNLNETVVEHVKRQFSGAVSCNQGSDVDTYSLNRITALNNSKFTNETISCIIPCYNYGDFLSEAIESVLRQTIKPFEIIIADDCSVDMTEEVGLAYQRKYPQLIKYVKNEQNLGIVANFTKAIGLSSGSYIVFLGADNRFQSNYLEECAGILNTNKDVAIAYTDFLYFGNRAKTLYNGFKKEYQSTIANEYYKIEFPEAKDIDVLETLKKENFVHGSSMYRREAFIKVGGYQPIADIPEDYNLFVRIVQAGYKIKKANKTVLQYRQHSFDQANHRFGNQSLTNLYMIRVKELEAELNFLKKYKIIAAISLGFKAKNNAKKLINYLKKNGLNKTFSRLINK